MSYAWLIWLVIAAVFMAGEVITAGFFLLWFGVGALLASLIAFLGFSSLPLQVAVFVASSILMVFSTRTLLKPYLQRGNSLRTGVEKMAGETVVVVQAGLEPGDKAAIKYAGSVWTADVIEGEAPLLVGESVRIDHVEGNIVYVYRPFDRHLISN